MASGPSAKNVNVEALRGRLPVVAIKRSLELCPWADVVYGCDAAWWVFRNGLPEFKGLKITWCGDNEHPPAKYDDLHLIEIDQSQARVYPHEVRVHHMQFDAPGLIGNGGNSGYQAINLAAQFGANRILLIGFDVKGSHWYGRNDWRNANNTDDAAFARWIKAFDAAAMVLRERGVEVVNASPSSALKCFPIKTIEQTLESWPI